LIDQARQALVLAKFPEMVARIDARGDGRERGAMIW
jgi:hypothetical protein